MNRGRLAAIALFGGLAQHELDVVARATPGWLELFMRTKNTRGSLTKSSSAARLSLLMEGAQPLAKTSSRVQNAGSRRFPEECSSAGIQGLILAHVAIPGVAPVRRFPCGRGRVHQRDAEGEEPGSGLVIAVRPRQFAHASAVRLRAEDEHDGDRDGESENGEEENQHQRRERDNEQHDERHQHEEHRRRGPPVRHVKGHAHAGTPHMGSKLLTQSGTGHRTIIARSRCILTAAVIKWHT
jgi:hypothetical protein